MKGAIAAGKAVIVTAAVYSWLAVSTVREVRHSLMHRLRGKYVQRPIDF